MRLALLRDQKMELCLCVCVSINVPLLSNTVQRRKSCFTVSVKSNIRVN